LKINGSCLRFAKYTLCVVTSMLADYKHSSLPPFKGGSSDAYHRRRT